MFQQLMKSKIRREVYLLHILTIPELQGKNPVCCSILKLLKWISFINSRYIFYWISLYFPYMGLETVLLMWYVIPYLEVQISKITVQKVLPTDSHAIMNTCRPSHIIALLSDSHPCEQHTSSVIGGIPGVPQQRVNNMCQRNVLCPQPGPWMMRAVF